MKKEKENVLWKTLREVLGIGTLIYVIYSYKIIHQTPSVFLILLCFGIGYWEFVQKRNWADYLISLFWIFVVVDLTIPLIVEAF
jgi:hypothetical protein